MHPENVCFISEFQGIDAENPPKLASLRKPESSREPLLFRISSEMSTTRRTRSQRTELASIRLNEEFRL